MGKEQNDIIINYFKNHKNGVFLDIGCAQFQLFNKTYNLEKHLNWTGIAVDALSEYAKGYINNRPKTRFFNYIITDHSDTIEPFYKLHNMHAARSTTNKKYIDEILKVSDYRILYIPTITMDELLSKNRIEKINFLSIDIEGSEMDALNQFTIQKHTPELVNIEVHNNEQAIYDYFAGNNYKLLSFSPSKAKAGSLYFIPN